MQSDTLKALMVLTEHLDFFTAPFLDQDKFRQWVLSSGQETKIRSLTDSLYVPLTNPVSYLAEYIDALIGKSLDPYPRNCLRYGDSRRMIELLEKNKSVKQSIIYISSNTAIKTWEEDNPILVQKTKKITQLFQSIENLQKESEKLHALGLEQDAELVLGLVAKIKEKTIQLVDNTEEGAAVSFCKECSSMIIETNQQLANHWSFKQKLKHLLFLINNTMKHNFSSSFFKENSALMKAMDLIENQRQLLNSVLI